MSVQEGKHQISGAVVPVRLGLVLAVCGAFSALLLLADLLEGISAWHRFLFAAVALVLSGWSAYLGIYGVIRYGLFTEGCGAGEVEQELRLSKVAWAAGAIAQVTLIVSLVLTAVLLAQALS